MCFRLDHVLEQQISLGAESAGGCRAWKNGEIEEEDEEAAEDDDEEGNEEEDEDRTKMEK